MRRLSGTVLAVLLVPLVGSGAVGQRVQPQVLDLVTADAAQAERIEAAFESPRDGRLATQPITDLLLTLRPMAQELRPTAWRGRGLGEDHASTFIEARLHLVIAGRLSSDGRARCDRFEGDTLRCVLDCDGGEFGLRHVPGREHAPHALLIGASDRSDGRPQLGFTIGACRAGSQERFQVRPRPGRLAVELLLRELR